MVSATDECCGFSSDQPLTSLPHQVQEQDRFDGLLLGIAQQCHGIDNLLEVRVS
jgi:hypothetical protein